VSTAASSDHPRQKRSAEARGTCAVGSNRGMALQRSWRLVTESRGDSDHRKRVTRFAAMAKNVSDDVSDDDSCDRGDLPLLAAELSYEGAELVVEVLTSGDDEAKKSAYQPVQDAGDDLMTELDVKKRF
jgi:hypothetical protein